MRWRLSTPLGVVVGIPILIMAVLTGSACAEERASPRPSVKAAGPTDRPPADHIRDVQQALTTAGYDPGPIDGVMGPRTRAAVRKSVAVPAPHAPSPPDTRIVRPTANTEVETP